eukprot:m.107056 g.107056  ORF g.107056 m.107056 type:complete len:349 (+) comp22562_c0_seq3:56-1102(+)
MERPPRTNSFCSDAVFVHHKDCIPNKIVLLGRLYDIELDQAEKARFYRDVATRILMTYRRGFPCIGKTSYTSDAGWGCMLRTGQMMLAQIFLSLKNIDDWAITAERTARTRDVISLFADVPSAPYSIQKIALAAAAVGKKPGQWCGPNDMAQIARILTKEDPSCPVVVHVAMDRYVAKQDIDKLNTEATWQPLVLLIPLRLGLHQLERSYIPGLKRMFCLPQCVGIMGGKPNSAHYFVGVHEEDGIYLDPHITQEVVEMKPKFSLESFSCSKPGRMKLSMLDPSICLGFLCKTRKSLDDLLEHFSQAQREDGKNALFTVGELSLEEVTNFDDFEDQEETTSVDGFELL